MSITPGSKLAFYEVVAPLGAGAMGEVWRAKDTKLGREVAIKVLPEHFADDEERLKRFEREAKTLASLNHPNVAQIFGVDQVGDTCFLVLELVPGESLEERLKRGPLSIDETLDVCKQIAEGLEAAHEAGVIHRDLKPANIRLTPEGKVKVLDFGLAKPASESGSGSSTDSVLSTEAGRLLGTPTYMAPEQARGKNIDKRVDIWAFGCVLYECLTAKRAFAGETLTDVLGAVLHTTPDLSRLPANTPRSVRELVASCFEKDPRQRLRDCGDARRILERAHDAPAEPAASRPRKTWVSVLLRAAFAVLLIGMGWFLATRWALPLARAPRTASLLIPSRTSTYCFASSPVLSPDGRFVAFVARQTGAADTNLWVRALDSFEAKPLPETLGAGGQFWSADGRSIAFHAEGKLWAANVEQGGSRRLLAAEPYNDGASWGPDGTILVARSIGGAEGNGGIFRIPSGGGKPELATAVDAKAFERAHEFPVFLPDGKRFLYLVIDRKPDQEVSVGHLYAGRIGSTERTFVADLTSPVTYVEPGWLVYVDDGTIKAAPFDVESLRITGEAITIADDVSYFRPTGSSVLSVASDGTIAFVTPADEQQLVWFDSAGVRLGTLGPKGNFDTPRISPDGKRVVAHVADRRTGLADLWIYGVDRPSSTRLTNEASWEGLPVWSADGATIYYSSDKNDYPEIYSIRADGSGDKRLVYGPGSGGRVWFPLSASPDGKSLMMSGIVEKLDSDLRVLPLDGSTVAIPFRSTAASETWAKFSPDGRWVAYVSNESGKSEVYIAPYPGPGPKVQVSDGGIAPAWSPGSDKLYFIQLRSGVQTVTAPARVMVVELDQPGSFGSPPPPKVLLENTEDIAAFEVAPDGKRFLLLLAPSETPPLRLILNGLPDHRPAAAAAKR